MQYLAAFLAWLGKILEPHLSEFGAFIAGVMASESHAEAKSQKQRADALQDRMDVDQAVAAMSDADVHKRLYDDYGPRGVQRVEKDNAKS